MTEKLSKLFNYITSKSQSKESVELYKLQSGGDTGVPFVLTAALRFSHRKRATTRLDDPPTHTQTHTHTRTRDRLLKCSLIK